MVDLLTLEVAVAIFPLIVAFGVTVFIIGRRNGPLIKILTMVRRKKKALLLFADSGDQFRFYDATKGSSGMFHTKAHEFATDGKSVKVFSGIGTFAIASQHTAGTLPPKFLWEKTKINEYFWNTQKKESEQVADMIEDLRKREANCKDVIDTTNDILSQKITLDDAVTKKIIERNLDPNDMATREQVKRYLTDAKDTDAKVYKDELLKIEAEKNIPLEEPVSLKWVNGKPFISSADPMTISDYMHVVNIGSDADSVREEIYNATQQELLENSDSSDTLQRWLTLGVFVFLCLLGVYIVLGGVKV